MRVEEAKVLRFAILSGHRGVRNPDTLAIVIDFAEPFLAGGFFGARTGEERAMQQGHLHLSAVIRNSDGEEAGILVVHVDEIDAVVGSEGRKPEPLPMKQIL